MEQGEWWLISCPWFWTVVGRFVRQVNFQECLMEDVIYFTRTGATFDKLSTKGIVAETQYNGPSVVGQKILVPTQGLKYQWLAPTPWANKKGKGE